MAYVFFDSSYAPCGFLIVPDDGDPYDDNTALIQTDWDFPGVASRTGWSPCWCGKTDGTIDCEHKTAIAMISEAYEHLRVNQQRVYPELDEYLPEDPPECHKACEDPACPYTH